MKILYLITKTELGGAQSHVGDLCEYFSKQNEVVVMSYPGGWLEDECKKLNVKFIPNTYFSNSINPVNLFKATSEIKKVLNIEKPDIVHCHSSGAGFFGRLAIKNLVPTLFTAHGWGFNTGVPFLQKWIAIFSEKFVSRYSEKIISVSEFVKNLGLKYKIAGKEKFEVVYNGVGVDKSIKENGNGKIKIIFVGRLAEPKNPLVLLKAYNQLQNDLKEKTEVNIIGDGPKKKELELFIEEGNLKNINLLGSLHREQVFDRLNKSDIFVLVSAYEGLPYTILEAMSVGLPIIASDVGGIKEMVENDVNGFLLKNNSVKELKIVLEKLIEDKGLRERMGKKSIEVVLEKFSIEKMLKQTKDLYNKILKK